MFEKLKQIDARIKRLEITYIGGFAIFDIIIKTWFITKVIEWIYKLIVR